MPKNTEITLRTNIATAMQCSRDKERQTKIEAIRMALIEGEESGLSDRSPEEIIRAVIERCRNGKL